MTAPKAPAPGGVDPGADAEAIAKGMANVRLLLQRTGVALGAAATAVLSGLGYTQLHQIFPIPANVAPLTKLALGAAVASAVLGSVWLAVRFLYAQRQILLGTDSDGWIDVHGAKKKTDEWQLVEKVLAEHAREEQARTLLDVELRALRLERVARLLASRRDVGRPDEIHAEADRLFDVVRAALGRAALKLIQERSRRAFQAWRTKAALVLAVAGIAGTFGIADYYKGKRDLPESLAACLKAKADVPDACAPFETKAQRAKRQRDVVILAKEARSEVEKVRALPLTPAKARLLGFVKDCSSAVKKLKVSLSDDAKASAIALCAVGPE